MENIDSNLHRRPSKTCTFETVYGMQGEGLQATLATMGLMWSLQKCEDFIKEWFKLYKGVKVYMDAVHDHARRYGWGADMFGRRRWVPNAQSRNKRLQAEARRESGNHPIQSGAQGIIKRAMGDLVPVHRSLRREGVTVNLIISSSIGISMYPSDGDDAQSLLKHADLAMYHAKDMGKNNFIYFNESMKASAFARLNMEGELNTALIYDEFSIHYQATLDVRSRKITGSEALIRWQHPKKELISPSGFIPTAEDTGQIISIDEWVLRRACLQNKAWQKAGLEPIVVAVNLSTTHFDNQKLIEMVKRALHDADMDRNG